MNIKIRIFSLLSMTLLIAFSQNSTAIIIDSYTAVYEDGSKLLVDLKGYDYGMGSYYAPSDVWADLPAPTDEGFDAYFYPSQLIQDINNEIGGLVRGISGDGLYFEVDGSHGVRMIDFSYMIGALDTVINDHQVELFDYYATDFAGGYFKTHSPHRINEPGSIPLLAIGLSIIGWACQRKKTKRSIHTLTKRVLPARNFSPRGPLSAVFT